MSSSNEGLIERLLKEKMVRDDPKCWLCAKVTKPGKNYSPNICWDCKPAYSEKTFLFVRATQAELDELFPTLRNNTGLEKGDNEDSDL